MRIPVQYERRVTTIKLSDYRCPNCSRLLLKGKYDGIIEIICRHCREPVTFQELKETSRSG
jgi:phage FluMu protein Com